MGAGTECVSSARAAIVVLFFLKMFCFVLSKLTGAAAFGDKLKYVEGNWMST